MRFTVLCLVISRLLASHAFLLLGRQYYHRPTSRWSLFLSSTGDSPDQRRQSSRFQGNSRPPTQQELEIMDQMIDKLSEAKVYELPAAVKSAFRIVSSPQFFLRIAARQDVAKSAEERAKLSALASNLVSTLEAVVSLGEERQVVRAKEVESVIKAAAEPDSGEFLVPLLPARIQAMRNALLKLDPSSLDEGFLSTLDAWMNKSHEDGMNLMVGILQKAMQMYAGIVLERASPTTDDEEASTVFQNLLKSDADEWDVVLMQTDVPLPRVQAAVQKTMESIVLNLDSGSMAQRVQAEYLQELVKRIENASNKKI